MSERWVVVGSGVGGLAGAWLLARAGHRVRLLERGTRLGRASAGFQWNGLWLDHGCHLFGNDSARTTEILLALLGGEAEPVSIRTASVTRGAVADGTELPDLRDAPDPALRQLLAASAEAEPGASSLRAWLDQRYGAGIGAGLAEASRKMWKVRPEVLEPEARHAGPFRRVCVVPDETARLLKLAPALDDRIAVRSQPDPLRYARDLAGAFPARNLYPRSKGMAGFAASADRVLREAGVEISFEAAPTALERGPGELELELEGGESVAAERVLWTDGLPALEPLWSGTRELSAYVHTVPMVLVWFAIESGSAGPWCYVHDWDDEDWLYRASLPAHYGAPSREDGRSILCCEVPTAPDGEPWLHPDRVPARVWEEAVRCGAVSGSMPEEHLVRRMERTYRLPLRGYAGRAELLRKEWASDSRLGVPADWAFTSSASVAAVDAALHAMGGI